MDLNALMDTEKTKMLIAMLSVVIIWWSEKKYAMMEKTKTARAARVIVAQLKMDGHAQVVLILQEDF